MFWLDLSDWLVVVVEDDGGLVADPLSDDVVVGVFDGFVGCHALFDECFDDELV